jgi:tRNA(fMet)-specific endonuclease VapC
MIYALDTNVVIEILNRNITVCKRRDVALERGNDLIIPVVTDYEIWRGFYYRPASAKQKAYVSLCDLFPVCQMTSQIWKRSTLIYADLRSKGRTVDDADIFIAAMCIEKDYTLVTHNTRHYDGVDGLVIEDWQRD